MGKVSSVDLSVIAAGLASGILIIVLTTELSLGTVVGGRIGPILATTLVRPVTVPPPLLPSGATMVEAMLLVSTTAGVSTVTEAKYTDRGKSETVTLVPAITPTTLSIPSAVIGTVSGPTPHLTITSVPKRLKETYLTTHGSRTVPTGHPAHSVQGRGSFAHLGSSPANFTTVPKKRSPHPTKRPMLSPQLKQKGNNKKLPNNKLTLHTTHTSTHLHKGAE